MKDGTDETRLCLVAVAEFVVVTALLCISDDTLTCLRNKVVADTDALQIVAPITIGKPVVLGIV